MKRPELSPSAVTVSDRTCLAIFGLAWPELRRFLEERGISYTHVGRRPIVVVADVLAALDGARVAPWTDDDTRRRLRAAIGKGVMP